jgi:hypothetical protein
MAGVRSEAVAFAVAAATGIGAWELVRHLGRRREAWDDPIFWQLGYPLMVAVAFGLGLLWRDRPWRWVAAMLAVQAVWSLALALIAAGVPNLFPLGLIVFAVLSLPCLLAAHLGKWIGARANI